jgi:uracil-DNA glycosylase family 4
MSLRVETDLRKLQEKVVSCRKCPRLTRHISSVAMQKTPRYRSWKYWAKPLPSFGDPHARLLIIGLAPAAHGGNRTGRMFTGDSSGDWLVKALYQTGFANQPHSVSSDDGLRLKSAYITAVVRCAPPENKPTRQEILNCSEYLAEELRLLRDVKVVVTLGRMAFDSFLRTSEILRPYRPSFKHGATYRFKGAPLLVASYHPSRQNTQTGRLTWHMWLKVFKKVKKELDQPGRDRNVHRA